MLKASEFPKKYHVNNKGLKKEFSITLQQAKDIIKRYPTCSFIAKYYYLQGVTQEILKGMKYRDGWVQL